MLVARCCPALCLFAAACAAPANPPSLARRAIETQSTATAPSAPVETVQPIAADLNAKLVALRDEARAGDDDFMRTAAAGANALSAGRNAAAGSEPWIAAELVRSALQVARQRSAGALAEVDALAVRENERASRDATTGGLAEIAALQAEIEAIVARQTERLDALNR